MLKQGKEPKTDLEGYNLLLNEFRTSCAEEGAKVLRAGGLRVIGTERHESRRIDNQLRGRSGRQGDPGESRFYIALEDDIIRLFGGERIQGIMERLGMSEGDCIEHPLLTKAIENAQKKVEEMHFDMRKQLLAFDNVMNQQREAIYTERSEILNDEDIIERTKDIFQDTARALLERIFAEGDDVESTLQAVSVRLNALYWPGISKHIENVQTQADLDESTPLLLDEIVTRFNLKVQELGIEVATTYIPIISFLEVLDTNWKEHLLAWMSYKKRN